MGKVLENGHLGKNLANRRFDVSNKKIGKRKNKMKKRKGAMIKPSKQVSW